MLPSILERGHPAIQKPSRPSESVGTFDVAVRENLVEVVCLLHVGGAHRRWGVIGRRAHFEEPPRKERRLEGAHGGTRREDSWHAPCHELPGRIHLDKAGVPASRSDHEE